jgi:hypothetical protein
LLPLWDNNFDWVTYFIAMEKERQGKWKWSFVDCSSPLPREIPCPLSSIVCARVGHHWKGVCNNKGER